MTSAILVLALLVTTGTETSERETPLILDFSATWCGPCQAMRPVVEQLRSQGYPIRAIDIDQHPELASRYKVLEVPKFVFVDRQGREIGRVSGVRPASELASLYKKAQARLDQRNADSTLAQTDESDRTTVRAQDPGEEPEPESAATVEHFDPWQTVVRIKVVNHLSRPRTTIGFGSGTIIHSTADEAIILTCAHIFRIEELPRQPPPSKFPLKVMVDLFDGRLRESNTPNQTPYVRTTETNIPAEVIDYDLAGDVGLIRIRPGRPLPYSMVVPPGWTPEKGQKLNTVGCSEGRDATAWTTRVTSPLIRMQPQESPGIYEGTECSHPPLRGRSGGGLFTMGGRLAGVCDFNDGHYGHGLYASPRTIHRLLNRHNLQICYATEDARPRADRSAIARNENDRNPAPKIRAQSPQLTEGGVMPIPPPEMLGVRLPEVPEAEQFASADEDPSGSESIAPERRYRWKAAPDADLELADRTTRPVAERASHRERERPRPHTARMEMDQDAAGNDLFVAAPDFDNPTRAQPLPPVRRSSSPRTDGHWRPAEPETARAGNGAGNHRRD